MHTGTQDLYTIDTDKQKICLLISEELAALGIILISISAWRGSSQR